MTDSNRWSETGSLVTAGEPIPSAAEIQALIDERDDLRRKIARVRLERDDLRRKIARVRLECQGIASVTDPREYHGSLARWVIAVLGEVS